MTRVLGTDSNNDIHLGPTGRLVIHTGLTAVLQACEHVVKAQLGEMVLAIDKGIPNFQSVWNGSPNLGQFEAAIRDAISSVPDVIRVTEFDSTRTGSVLAYSATIETIHGIGVING